MRIRSIKDLLKLLLQSIIDQKDELFCGLCSEVDFMSCKNYINIKEELILLGYIYSNRKNRKYNLNKVYWWKPKNKPPRLRWCSKHIKTNN